MLWDFGFRHHPDLQTRWIEGSASLGVVAALSDKMPSEDDFNSVAEDFLAANNPDVLDAVKRASAEDKAELLKKLEKNFSQLQNLINSLKED